MSISIINIIFEQKHIVAQQCNYCQIQFKIYCYMKKKQRKFLTYLAKYFTILGIKVHNMKIDFNTSSAQSQGQTMNTDTNDYL